MSTNALTALQNDCLYGITPDAIDASWLFASADAAFGAGLKVLQLRSKHIAGHDREQLATALMALTRQHKATLIINDDASLAAAVGAHGVHLGGTDGDIAAARRLLGDAAIIGASCYNSLDKARVAVSQGASYVAFGALFLSSTKPQAPRADLALFQQAASLGVPMVGIGGITLANAGSVVAAGASAVAVVSELFPAEGEHTASSYSAQVAHNTAFFLKLLNKSHTENHQP